MNKPAIPFLKSDRLVFWLVFVAGMALCTAGGIGNAAVHGWLLPATIAGSVLGGLALLLGASVLFRIRVAPVSNDRAATVALLSIIVVKFIITIFYQII